MRKINRVNKSAGLNVISPKISGFLAIDKPAGITSFDVIKKLRKLTGIKHIGHGGALDPFATGVLIVAIGRPATRHLKKFLSGDKIYLAKIKLGAVSDTFDRDGKIKEVSTEQVAIGKIKKIIKRFVGEIEQVPPIFSALKIRGKPAYKYARASVKITLAPRKIIILSIKILAYEWPFLTISVKCGKGTYIRSLANDIGIALGCGGYLTELRRENVCGIDIQDSVPLDAIKSISDIEKFLITA